MWDTIKHISIHTVGVLEGENGRTIFLTPIMEEHELTGGRDSHGITHNG